MTTIHDVQEKLSTFVESTPEYGDLGRLNANGSVTYDAAGRPGWVYYRTRRGSMQTLDIAQDGGVPRVPGLPIKIERDTLGRKIIRAGNLDPTRVTRYLGTSSPPVVIGRHSHEFGYGNEDWVSNKRLKAGQVRVNVDFTATISDFYYIYDEVHYYFPQTSVDLSTHVPSTPSEWWWVKIVFEPVTNTVSVLEGTSTSTLVPLTSQDLADIALTWPQIPLAGIKITYGQTTIGDESDTEACWPWTGTTEIAGGSQEYILIQDRKSQNTNGGTFTSGAWRTRDLNTIVTDTTGAVTLSSNQITLPTGTYRVRAKVPAFYVNRHQARLYDITNSAILLLGTSEYNSNGMADSISNYSLVEGRFTLSGSTVIELQHQCQTTFATSGFGVCANFTTEIYSSIEIIKE